MHKPSRLIDNHGGNTLAEGLRRALILSDDGAGDVTATEKATIVQSARIATAFFNPEGFSRIADELSQVPQVRLLIGAEPPPESALTRRPPGEQPDQYEARRLNENLHRLDKGLHRGRDWLPFSRTNIGALRKLVAALKSENFEARRYTQAFLHAKAYILDGGPVEPGLIIGSSNFTAAGLARNLELNLLTYEKQVADQAGQWFDELWENAEPFDLADIYTVVLENYPPWLIFLRVLWQLYGAEIMEEIEESEGLPLTSFQHHGVIRAQRLIEKHGGAIVADEVGLGKTFIAGEIIKRCLKNRQRSLIVCPAALRDGTWKQFTNKYQLYAECISYEQLGYDRQLSNEQRPRATQENLRSPMDEYQLIIIDEAHNYRNPDAPYRAGVLRQLLYGNPRNVLMLTATPVNNSLWDLYYLMWFFMRQDAQLADLGILSIRDRFREAMMTDPANLNPDLLYPIIDATTVKRTRQFVKKHYAGDTILVNGKPQTIVFPAPVPITVRYTLDEVLPGFFDDVKAALDPGDEDSPNREKISFARYTPEQFLLESERESDEFENRANALAALISSGLLKRFESSIFAFRETLNRMIEQHSFFLRALADGKVVTTRFLTEVSADEESFNELLESANDEQFQPAYRYDVERLKEQVEEDVNKMQDLVRKAEQIQQEQDPKLIELACELEKIALQAEKEAANEGDEKDKRKVLIFSFFEDTVRWIWGYLQDLLETSPEKFPALSKYRDRVAAISGSGRLDKQEGDKQRVIHDFAPISSQSPGKKDLHDLLITTDVLAEGVNLQQCRNIINYDMPWNPMRLVQRHGRIDRIGSPHDKVFLRTIFPVDQLDEMLGLEERFMRKLAMAAASIGITAPIQGAPTGKQVFSETRREIERLLQEDPSLFERGGTESAAQTGEEYRQTLRKMLDQDRERIVNLPWKAGAGMLKGSERGFFFCAAVGEQPEKPNRTFLRFVRADENWDPLPSDAPDDGEQQIIREIGTCLRLIECEEDTQKYLSDKLQEIVYDFWDIAREDIWKGWMYETDPAHLQPRIRPLNHKVAEFIRSNIPTGIEQKEVQQALDILESPWPGREERMLREWFANEEYGDCEKAEFLIKKILETGFEPFNQPDPLPPIQDNEVHLICWMAITPELNSNKADRLV